MAVTVGLDIGTVGVRAAVVDSARSKFVLRRYADMPLPLGAVASGEIIDEDAVAEAVAALWKRAKLPKRRVVIGSANQRVVVRQVDVPQMDETELIESLPFQVQDSIPIAVEEAILDFVPLERFTTPEGEAMMSILVVAVQREVVDKLMRVASAAGLTLEAVDLQAFGLVRALVGHDFDAGGPADVIVDIGGSVTQVVIARAGVARFVRLVPRGGEDFTDILVSEMGLDFDDAEALKRRVGVVPEGRPLRGETEDEEATALLTGVADTLIEDIRGSINYFVAQAPDEGGIGRVLVAGNAARLPHLANRLGRALGIAVEAAKVLQRVEVGKVRLSEDELLNAQPVLPTSIGLGMWGEQA